MSSCCMHFLVFLLGFVSVCSSVQFYVSNNCPFGVLLNGGSLQGPLLPANVYLAPGDKYVYYNISDPWISGRVTAAPDSNNPGWIGLAEMTITNGNINYDISYVDSLVMPASIQGGSAGCDLVGCAATFQDTSSSCPSGPDYDLTHPSGFGCIAACDYCENSSNAVTSFCQRLNGQIHDCVTESPSSEYCYQASDDTTVNVYCCSGYFDGQPVENHTAGNKYCAAINRGILMDPSSDQPSEWYQLTNSTTNEPLYNEYSAYVHRWCPNQYGFAYDDYDNPENPDAECATDTLYITWCPLG